MASTLPHDNAVRWTREQYDGHVESYFVKATSPDARRAIWLKHTLLVAPGPEQNGVAETWFVAFERGSKPIGVKVRIPIAHGSYRSHPFSLVLGPCVFDSKSAKGSVASNEGEIVWDFALGARLRTYRALPFDWMYTASFPRSKTTTPAPQAKLSGSLSVFGEEWDLMDWTAAQGHNWGTAHAHRWTWAQCCAFDGASDAWFESVSAKVRVVGVPSPWLSIGALQLAGKLYRFDSPASWLRAPCKSGPFAYEVTYSNAEARVVARVEAGLDDVVCLRYENPDGSVRSCLNSKLARLQLDVRLRDGTRRELTSDCCALELGVPEHEHDLPTLL